LSIYNTRNTYIAYAYSSCKQSATSVLRILFKALSVKSRYFPPSSLVITNLRSCTENMQNG